MHTKKGSPRSGHAAAPVPRAGSRQTDALCRRRDGRRNFHRQNIKILADYPIVTYHKMILEQLSFYVNRAPDLKRYFLRYRLPGSVFLHILSQKTGSFRPVFRRPAGGWRARRSRPLRAPLCPRKRIWTKRASSHRRRFPHGRRANAGRSEAAAVFILHMSAGKRDPSGLPGVQRIAASLP